MSVLLRLKHFHHSFAEVLSISRLRQYDAQVATPGERVGRTTSECDPRMPPPFRPRRPFTNPIKREFSGELKLLLLAKATNVQMRCHTEASRWLATTGQDISRGFSNSDDMLFEYDIFRHQGITRFESKVSIRSRARLLVLLNPKLSRVNPCRARGFALNNHFMLMPSKRSMLLSNLALSCI
jgi:hypothetical protein